MRVAPVLCLLATATALTVPSGSATSSGAARVAGVGWADASGTAAERAVLPLRVTVGAGAATEATVRVGGGAVVGLPDACALSSVVRRRSYVSADGTTLVCDVVDERAQELAIEVRAGVAPGPLTVTITDGGVATAAPVREVLAGPPDTPRRLRLLSSPDFLNADIADLRRGPGLWNRNRSANSTSPAYERAIDHVLDDWQRQQPDGVLVAGDLVDGRWGRDVAPHRHSARSANGAQRATAARRAAATYYPQYVEALPRPRPRPLRRARRPRVRRRPLDRLQAPARPGVPGAVRALFPRALRPAGRGSATTRRGRMPGRRTRSGRCRTCRW